ncbi:MAG: group 1 truncated hemoglobin [Nevskia sp.]|nr:group 1 truncated hemoglobin [Nevskia sp.]
MSTTSHSEGQGSLFDRIGGAKAVRSLVEDFYALVLADPSLAHFFAHADMNKLRRMQYEMFAAALGGPVKYTGRPIVHAHHGLNIALVDYQRFVQHLFDTLAKFPLSEQDCYDIISRLNLYTNDVVSAGTGIVG